MNANDLLAIYEASLRTDSVPGGRDAMWLDWHELFRRESHDEWLVRDMWPMDRQVHVHAARKTGKSLVALWIACNLAMGRIQLWCRECVVGFLAVARVAKRQPATNLNAGSSGCNDRFT